MSFPPISVAHPSQHIPLEQHKFNNEPKQKAATHVEAALSTHTMSAMLVGFISRILIEKNFFQNTQVPVDTVLYLANDLIKVLCPQKKNVFSLSREVSLLWKQYRGESLTSQEQAYLEDPQELDVTGEILNGLKYSSMALIGQSLYQSVTSAITGQLWKHVPAICGYFSLAMTSPQIVAYSVSQVLQNVALTKEQKSLLEPWLNMVGRLAFGFIPKVHATEQGVHYHYPSLEGYSKTVSSHEVVILNGDRLSVQRIGHLQTPQGSFEGVYETDLKLNQIDELSEERIRIQVTDQHGTVFPVVFTRTWGQYGPQINVSSDNKELEYQWSQYFYPKQHVLPQPHLVTERQQTTLYDELSCKAGLALDFPRHSQDLPISPTNLALFLDTVYSRSSFQLERLYTKFPSLSVFSMLSSLLIASRVQQSSLTPVIAVLLTLSLSKSVEAGFIGEMLFPQESAEKILAQVGQEARLTLGTASEALITIIQKFEGLQKGISLDFGKAGRLIIKQAGGELRILTEGIKEGTQAILKVAGQEVRFTVATVGKEVRAVVRTAGEEARLTLEKGGVEINGVLETTGAQIDKAIFNFGKEGRLTIEEIGKTTRITTDTVLKDFFTGSEATLTVGGKEVRLIIQTVGEETRLTVEKIGKETEIILDNLKQTTITTVGSSSSLFASNLIHGFWDALFGQSELQGLLQGIKTDIVNHGSKDKKELVGHLLTHVQNQSQENLSSSNKALLYVEIMKFINHPSVPENDKKCLLFVITAIASQDKKLTQTTSYMGFYPKITNYFNTVFLPALSNREVKEAFENSDFSSLKPQVLEYLDNHAATSPHLSVHKKSILIIESPQDIDSEGDIPIGTIIAYASDQLPSGYIRCDGSLYSKEAYSDLYQVLGGHYGEEEGKFRVPDYRNLYLRGANDLSEIGRQYDDTTRMPKNLFQITEDGAHTHKDLPSGEHSHQAELSGEHNHSIAKAGEHQHSLFKAGEHSHKVQTPGKHDHQMSEVESYGFDASKRSACPLPRADTKLDACLKPTSLTHHHHTIPKGGDHFHDINQAQAHTHNVSKAENHLHDLSASSAHSHKMSSENAHTHVILESEKHTHSIVGGDEETSPKNRKVDFLIKAKAQPAPVSKEIKELQSQIQKLRDEIENASNQGPVLLSTMFAGIIGALTLRLYQTARH